MVEKKRVVRTSTAKTAQDPGIPREKRCTHRFADGRQCRQPRWAGKEVCYQHDSSRGTPAWAREAQRQSAGFTVGQVQELLAMAFVEVMMGKMPVGRAYALGYVAQQMLAAQAVRAKEQKLDVKHFWEMVDLGATFERAAELAKQKKKEAEEGEENLTAENTENTEDTEDTEEGEEGEEAEEGGEELTTENTEGTEEGY